MLLKLQPVVLFALVAREASSLSLGQFNVSRSTQLLTDHSRQDTFASTSQPREPVISIFRPARNTCTTYASTPYMPLKTAQFEDATLGTVYGLPAGSITNLTLNLATCNTTHPTDPTPPNTPTTILFSPALGTTRHFYTLLAAALASATRAPVITIDHPHDADVVEYPNGTLVPGLDIASSSAQILLAVATRAQDMRFVLDTFTPPPCGSGGTPAFLPPCHRPLPRRRGRAGRRVARRAHPRLRLLPPRPRRTASVVSQKPTPFLAHEGKDLTTDPTRGAAWPRLRGWKRLLALEGAAHYTFSDLPALVERLFGGWGCRRGRLGQRWRGGVLWVFWRRLWRLLWAVEGLEGIETVV